MTHRRRPSIPPGNRPPANRSPSCAKIPAPDQGPEPAPHAASRSADVTSPDRDIATTRVRQPARRFLLSAMAISGGSNDTNVSKPRRLVSAGGPSDPRTAYRAASPWAPNRPQVPWLGAFGPPAGRVCTLARLMFCPRCQASAQPFGCRSGMEQATGIRRPTLRPQQRRRPAGRGARGRRPGG